MSFLSFLILVVFASFFFSPLFSLAKGLSILFALFQGTILGVHWFFFTVFSCVLSCYSVFYFIDFYSDLYHILTSAYLGLICSFSSFLKWKLRLLVWDLSFFLIWAFNAASFPLSTTLATSHKFWYDAFISSFSSTYFLIYLLNFWVIVYVSRSTLFISQLFEDFPNSWLLLIFNVIVINEHILYGLNSFKVIYLLITHKMLYLDKCSIFT